MMHAALSVWILSAVICVGRSQLGHGHSDQDTAVEDSANRLSLVSLANREFSFRLYRKLAAHADSQGKNIFYSPSSVSTALAALSTGARGETHRQLFRGLGFNDPLTQTDVDQTFRKRLSVETRASGEDTTEGTAVFMDNSFKARPEFLETLKQSYSAEGFMVNFTETENSTNTINMYVKDKTKGKIEKLVKDLDPSTIMYLVSYIYFKGKWETPFNPNKTKPDEFNVDENTKVPVQMMNKEMLFDTYQDLGINTSVLRIPFSSSYSMLLLLPEVMATLESAIDAAHITKWLKWMNSRTYDVYIPKFSIKTSYSMNDVLSELGVTDLFSDLADLSGIAEGQRLKVSQVVHQAALDVDETGATAAAATGIGIRPLSFITTPVMKFNRPFMVIITEHSTEDIMFMGKIVNPTSD